MWLCFIVNMLIGLIVPSTKEILNYITKSLANYIWYMSDKINQIK